YDTTHSVNYTLSLHDALPILFSNYPLMAAFSAIVFAQFIKVPVAYVLNRKTTIALVTSTGGMPSSHSAAVSSLITALALEYGIEDRKSTRLNSSHVKISYAVF